MRQELKVHFDRPEHHWLAIYLDAQNQHLVDLPFSYTPFDFVLESVRAVLNVLEGLDAKANCSYNPERYEFIFDARNNRGQLKVLSYPDHRTIQSSGQVIFAFEGSVLDLCLAFWRGLRELQGRISSPEYKAAFGRDFPQKEMELLTEKIKSLKQQVENYIATASNSACTGAARARFL